MIETNKFKLGLFVAGAVALFIVAVSCMGLFDFFSAKAYLRTTVTESIQGLNIGSSVKLRGVPIGKITNIIIHMDNKSICLEMEVDLTKFTKSSGGGSSSSTVSQAEFYTLLSREIRKGLRCRIEPDGITGMKYLEIDFFKDVMPSAAGEKAPRDPLGGKGKYFYVPSTPSMLASLRLGMTDILARIAMIDFDGIAKRTTLLLENVNKFMEHKRLDRLLADLDKCVESIRKTSDNLGSLVDKHEVNSTLAEIRKVAQNLSELSVDLRKNMDESKIPETVAGLRDLSDEIGDSTRSMTVTLQHLNDAIDALTEFAQYLNDNPSALIRGKQKSEDLSRD
ncbi:MAG: MCE family protein [Lentisphaeria bacterium]|nr:MCE family protein [Lentisphaeria bacterium]